VKKREEHKDEMGTQMSCVKRRRWLAQVALISTLTFAFGCAREVTPLSSGPEAVGATPGHVAQLSDRARSAMGGSEKHERRCPARFYTDEPVEPEFLT
jgi:hypothetical protein